MVYREQRQHFAKKLTCLSIFQEAYCRPTCLRSAMQRLADLEQGYGITQSDDSARRDNDPTLHNVVQALNLQGLSI